MYLWLSIPIAYWRIVHCASIVTDYRLYSIFTIPWRQTISNSGTIDQLTVASPVDRLTGLNTRAAVVDMACQRKWHRWTNAILTVNSILDNLPVLIDCNSICDGRSSNIMQIYSKQVDKRIRAWMCMFTRLKPFSETEMHITSEQWNWALITSLMQKRTST